MEKVVVSLDESAARRDAAVRWCAEHLDSSTSVVAVCGIGELGELIMSVPPFDSGVSEVAIENCAREEWCAPLRLAGIPFDVRLVHRRQASALLYMAALERPDALVMGYSRHHAMSNLFGADWVASVVQHATCPVLLIPTVAAHSSSERDDAQEATLATNQGRRRARGRRRLLDTSPPLPKTFSSS
jgi:nucleotide-binding universal stress UspA family protein